jgi:anti-sigma factor RsiW
MKWFFNPCGRYRRDICLLTGGVLPEPEQVQIKQHIAACAGCRKYYEEIKAMTVPLTNWEKDFAHLRPDQAAQNRWARAIQAVGRPEPVHRPPPSRAFREWYRGVIWPYRRIWAGLAVVWMVILAGNFSLHENSPVLAAKSSPASPEMIVALKEQQNILAELLADHSAPMVADRPKSFLPKPRTENVRIFMV